VKGAYDPVHLATLEKSATRRIDRHVTEGVLEHGREWAVAWVKHRLRYSDSTPEYIQIPGQNVSAFARDALMHHEVFELSKQFVATRLVAGVTSPLLIAETVSRFLSGALEAPTPPPGPQSSSYWGRDYIVFSVLSELRSETGLAVTENRHQKGVRSREPVLSAILERSIFASTMTPKLQQTQIENIWTNIRKRKEFQSVHSDYLVSLLDDGTDFNWV
jgi:hypothetical protein